MTNKKWTGIWKTMILRERMKGEKQPHLVGKNVGLMYAKKFIPVVKNG